MGKYRGLTKYNSSQVEEVMEILDMWNQIERDFEALPPIDRSVFPRSPRFKGFDANDTKNKHYYIASKLIQKKGPWTRFNDGRSLNSHSNILPAHRRMFQTYKSLGPEVRSRELTRDELDQILRAAIHPDWTT